MTCQHCQFGAHELPRATDAGTRMCDCACHGGIAQIPTITEDLAVLDEAGRMLRHLMLEGLGTGLIDGIQRDHLAEETLPRLRYVRERYAQDVQSEGGR